jgi:hypothetical protein
MESCLCHHARACCTTLALQSSHRWDVEQTDDSSKADN